LSFSCMAAPDIPLERLCQCCMFGALVMSGTCYSNAKLVDKCVLLFISLRTMMEVIWQEGLHGVGLIP